MTEEKLLRQHFGKNEPFKVPEGYFDSFADRLQSRIAQLPKEEKKKPTKHIRFVPKAWFAAAASVVVVASVGLSIMIPKWNSVQQDTATNTTAEDAYLTENNVSEDDAYYFDELDYAMIANNEIAYYLTEY